jgi:two-component system phosphate regulon response regulator PhoB/two-component system alkaline phosphatase synthesis response regulator PhoP
MNELVAIIDDEPDILELVSLHLTKAGFAVKTFTDAATFTAFLETNTPALIILDLMLPDTDGLELCKRLKRKDSFSAIPVIMLTAKGEETDKILGLELGADDYVTKPFSPKELVARVKAVLRRHDREEESKKISLAGKVVIDLEKYEVTIKGKKVELTTTEFRVLQLLASRKGYVFTRDNILDYLWGEEKAVVDRTIDVHIRHLREKLGSSSSLIKNVRGIGYKLEE